MKYLWFALLTAGFAFSTSPAYARGKPGGATKRCLQPALTVADAADNDDCVLNNGSGVILINGSVKNCGSIAVDVRMDLMVSTDGGHLYQIIETQTMRRLAAGATWQPFDLQSSIPAGYPANTLHYILTASTDRGNYRVLTPRLAINVSESCSPQQ